MTEQLSAREKKIDAYSQNTYQDTLQGINTIETKGLGNVSKYQPGQTVQNPYLSGQNIEAQHTTGMNKYINQFARSEYEDLFSDDEELINNLLANENEETALESQTKAIGRQEHYYFLRSERSLAQAERYQRLSKNDNVLRTHAAAHSNRSASKRAKKSREASKAYKKVARLQAAYDRHQENKHTSPTGHVENYGRENWVAQNLEDYNHVEKITRARIEALTLAAQVKSISKQQENYSIQMGTLKNLLILRDSLNYALQHGNKPGDAAALRKKQDLLKKEIEETIARVNQYAPVQNNNPGQNNAAQNNSDQDTSNS